MFIRYLDILPLLQGINIQNFILVKGGTRSHYLDL